MKKLILTLGICICTLGVAKGQTTIAQQDFDGGTPAWSYSSDVTFFDNGWGGDGYFNTIALGSASPLNNANFSGNILAENDLDDEGDNGTTGFANVTFASTDISAYTGVEITFNYDIVGYNATNDDVNYEVFHDGTGQGSVILFDGAGTPEDAEGSITINVPDAVDAVYLVLSIRNNGSTGYSGFDNFKVTGTSSGGTPTKLVITDVHSSEDPVEGETFSVTVQSQDGSSLPANVSQDTTVTLSTSSSTGTLSGTLSGTINNGSNSVTFSGLSYDVAETFTLNATNTGGSLTADTESVTILADADQLVIKDFPATGNKNIALNSFTVEAQRSSDNSVDGTYTENITVSKVSGSGAIGGTVTKAAVNGIATFDDITFDADDTYTISATDGSLTSSTSSSLVIESPDYQELFGNFPESGTSYNSGTFSGVASNTWTYVNARGTPQINGQTPGLQNNGTASLKSTISGGIDSFQFDYQQLFGTNVNLEVYINGNLVTTVTSSSESGVTKNSGTVDVDYVGDFEIEFKQGSGGGQVGIDNLFWNSKEGVSASISGTAGYRLLSSPVTATFDDVLGDFWTQGFTGADSPTAGISNVYYYDETVTDVADSGFTSIDNQTDNLNQGFGYAVYVFEDNDYATEGTQGGFPKTLVFSGTSPSSNVGPISYTFNSSGTVSDDGWNLAGNPFGSALNVDDLGFASEANLDNFVYVYRGGSYTALDASGTANTDTVAVGEGFFIKATGAVSYTYPIASASKSVKFNSRDIDFTLTSAQLSSKASLRFHEKAEFGKEAFDAYYLKSLESSHIGFYSKEKGNMLSVNSLPYNLDMEVEIPFEIAGTKTGEFTLNWTSSNFDSDWTLTLIDNVADKEINLQDVESYTFNVDGIVDDRFLVKATPSTSVSTDDEINQITEFKLEQNYPNPFNPSTTIKYAVGENGPVNITIYNVMGQKVAQLLNTTKTAGNYQITWNAAGVSSGIYYYRLTAPGQVLTRQMTLIK